MPLLVHHLYLAFESVMKLDNLAALGLTRLVVVRKARHGRGRCRRGCTHRGVAYALNWGHWTRRPSWNIFSLKLSTAWLIELIVPIIVQGVHQQHALIVYVAATRTLLLELLLLQSHNIEHVWLRSDRPRLLLLNLLRRWHGSWYRLCH